MSKHLADPPWYPAEGEGLAHQQEAAPDPVPEGGIVARATPHCGSCGCQVWRGREEAASEAW